MKTITLALLIAFTLPALADDAGAPLRAAAAAQATQTPVVTGSNGWLFLPAELHHVSVGQFWGPDAAKVSKATKPENADPLPAILDFKKQLDAAGIDLIMVPVPCKAYVYPEALTGGDPKGAPGARTDTYEIQFFDELRKNGITVIDLLPDMLASRNGPDGYVDCQQDSHWSGNGLQIAAKKISDELATKPYMKDVAKIKTSTKPGEVEITGDLWGMIPNNSAPKEKVKLQFVGIDGSGGATQIMPDKKSPIVLLGDSHNLVFHAGGDMLATGAGLPDQLANLLGTPVDLIAVRGSGATPARINLMRKAHADPAYLAGKKVVIWCFTEREFTEGNGWSLVPLNPK